jgi:hypothetical protein
MDKTAFSVVSRDEADDEDLAYWRGRPARERLAAIQYLREVMWGDRARQGLQRVLEIVQLKGG